MRGAAFRPLVSMFLLLLALPAHAIYRCEIDGHTIYSDAPCPGGRPVDIKLGPPSEDARERATREKEELAQIEKKASRQAQVDAKVQRRRERENAALQKRCEKLASRATWAAEDARRTSDRSAEKATRKAERAAEQYRAECADLNRRTGLIGISSR